MKKKIILIAMAIAITVALFSFFPSKTFDELMPLPDEVSVKAYHIKSILDRNYVSREWDAGSPQAKKILDLLQSTTYHFDLLSILPMEYENAGDNHYSVTLWLFDREGNRYTIGLLKDRNHIDLHSPGKSPVMSYAPENDTIDEQILAMLLED